ncbi:type II toxin-antitoxin system RelB/DinJ family antitoxin [Aerococcus urinae]|uniref:Type II toxin-antitoxin system RelB/DinJ family antitoxin n=1 Tax=Aerococcus urinae TaxID=1376 RepID=A0A7T2RR20_9LACT|nr:type II toxin-antitoxin system RelB/DinJ family antitoxin [Aerococcus urinae]AMB96530.1 hypothetical protein AWM73_08430 [Aerococcus urinae]MCY3032925.1 type II toxin-antitoxin system RelB/DinJ family antitoxin [Aerococcus urinae]MCY3038069.1 type II toxin-antitoxin system RelB/DinJ family antitoxin [Aerococcus urinae]MCY3044971.1 type II toxin-antitoxin system RelB/DinJ family antitoxin [Aerococcus urinae]MCY3048425.1 type II toxin-antitoxin system RelB/DinJ family antitoxin [Aerococcus ur
MTKKVSIHVRVDQDLKDSVQSILDDIGMDMSSAITVYLKAINRKQGIPFDLRLNAIDEALAEVEAGKGESYDSIDDWWEAMNADDKKAGR